MKTVLYLCLISLIFIAMSQQTIAQEVTRNAFKKGHKQLTFTYGYGQGDLVAHRSVTQLQAGYYVADQLMIGLTGSLMKEWVGEFHSKNMFSGGPLIRYQFTSGRLSPFTALAYQLGRPTLNPTVNQALLFTPGINLSLFPTVRLEASYSVLFVPFDDRIGQAQIGATFLFGSKR